MECFPVNVFYSAPNSTVFYVFVYFWCNVSVELRTKHIMRNQVSYLKEIGDGWFGKVTPGSRTRSLHKSVLELCICFVEGRSGRRC